MFVAVGQGGVVAVQAVVAPAQEDVAAAQVGFEAAEQGGAVAEQVVAAPAQAGVAAGQVAVGCSAQQADCHRYAGYFQAYKELLSADYHE